MTLTIYNLLIRLTDGSTEPLEFTGQTPSTVAAAAKQRMESDPAKRVEAIAVRFADRPAMVWLPRYEEWWHLLPEHVRKSVAEPDFKIETQRPRTPAPKPLNPPHSGATEIYTPPQISREQAMGSGYTGDMCSNDQCQSMQVKRNGSCTVCETCGQTTGCS